MNGEFKKPQTELEKLLDKYVLACFRRFDTTNDATIAAVIETHDALVKYEAKLVEERDDALGRSIVNRNALKWAKERAENAEAEVKRLTTELNNERESFTSALREAERRLAQDPCVVPEHVAYAGRLVTCDLYRHGAGVCGRTSLVHVQNDECLNPAPVAAEAKEKKEATDAQ